MTRPDQLGRMAQSFCDMHHDADRHRRRTYILERVGWALVGSAATVLIALITVAIRAAATATPPTF